MRRQQATRTREGLSSNEGGVIHGSLGRSKAWSWQPANLWTGALSFCLGPGQNSSVLRRSRWSAVWSAACGLLEFISGTVSSRISARWTHHLDQMQPLRTAKRAGRDVGIWHGVGACISERLRTVRFLRVCLGHRLAGLFQALVASPIGQQAKVPHFRKALWEDVPTEPARELTRIQRHPLGFAAVGIKIGRAHV